MTKGSLADAVVIERSFDAPVDLVWQMWTVPEHFEAWYGPAGAVVSVAKMDVRVGGPRLVSMEVETPGGRMKMWFAGEHLEVVEPKRLVYTEAVSDQDGAIPTEGVTEVRVELDEVGGRTKLVLTHAGIPAGSPGEAGWAMALDKLALKLGAAGEH